MQWSGVHLVPETLSFLERQAREIRAGEELSTVYLTDVAVPDLRQHPFFTGRGVTAELAEQVAYTLYLRAQQCAHVFRAHDAVTLNCRICGVQLHATPKGVSGDSPAPSGRWRRWNWFA